MAILPGPAVPPVPAFLPAADRLAAVPEATPLAEPNDPCPCGSGRKFKRCHGGTAVAGVRQAAPAAPAADPAAGGDATYDPFVKVFKADGSIDVEYVGKRIPAIVEILRKEPNFFEFRVDSDLLAETLAQEDARPVREAQGDDAFEAALRAFSQAHLHELIDEDLQLRLRAGFLEMAREPARSRRDRAAAAIGAALLSSVPDGKGLRGRALLDLVFRVTLEELHALEELRKKGRETEGGITAEELDAFWKLYPGLKWRHEQRYRREVTHTLEQIEAGNLPAAVSADLAMRGAHLLLSEVARRKAAGGKVEPVQAQNLLREPFGSDMLDGGREVVIHRWRHALHADPGGTADERRQFVRTLEVALRLVEDAGVGADAILFFAYLQAVVQGHYYVADQSEADAARDMFQATGLAAPGALKYADYLEKKGETDTLRRVALASIEIWPDDPAVRALAERVGTAAEAAAKAVRQGPTDIDDVIAEEEKAG